MSFLLFLLTYLAVQGVYAELKPSMTEMPVTDPSLVSKLIEEDLIGETFGQTIQAGDEVCGIMKISLEAWIDGSIFDSYFAELNRTVYLTGNLVAYDVFLDTYYVARTQFTRESEEPISGYRTMDHNSTRTKRGVPMLLAGIGIATYFGIDLIRSWFSEHKQMELVNAVRTELKQMENKVSNIELDLIRIKFTALFAVATSKLQIYFAQALNELFEKNTFVGSLIHSGERSVLVAMRELLGESYDYSVLRMYQKRAAKMIVASVRDINGNLVSVQVCLPATDTRNMRDLVRIVAMGVFTESKDHFVVPKLPEYMAIERGQNLSEAKFVNPSECNLVGSIYICKHFEEPTFGCELSLKKRSKCSLSLTSSSASNFTLVRSLVTGIVVATRLESGRYYEDIENHRSFENVYFEKPVALIVLPMNSFFEIGHVDIRSRTIGTEFTITFPNKAVDSPLLSELHYLERHVEEQNEMFHLFMIIAFVFALMFIVVIIILAAALYKSHTFNKKYMVKKYGKLEKQKAAVEYSYDSVA